MPHLRLLGLSNNKIRDTGICNLSSALEQRTREKPGRLDTLYLAGNEFGNLGCESLAQTLHSNAIPKLKVLNLSECQVDDAAILPLASAFATLPHIEQLILKKCANLGLDGTQALLATLKSAVHLKMLNLSGILQKQELKQLQRLFKDHNFVDTSSAPGLFKISKHGGEQHAETQHAGKGDARGVTRRRTGYSQQQTRGRRTREQH
eukprot:3812192-Prymnesium_polylepis.1